MRNFKKVLIPVLIPVIIVAAIITINSILNYLLVPYTHIRVDVHNVEEGDYEQIVLGTSHGKCGIDPAVLSEETGLQTINACRGSEYPEDVLYLLKDGARTHEIKRVIYEIDPAYLQVEANQNTDYVALYQEMAPSLVKLQYFFAKMANADFRTMLMKWYLYRDKTDSIANNIAVKSSDAYKNYEVLPSFSTDAQEYRADGFNAIHRTDAEKTETPPAALWHAGEVREDSLNAVKEIASFCQENEIELVLVITPIPAVTYETYEESYAEASRYMAELAAELDVKLLDCIQEGNSEDAASEEDGKSEDVAFGQEGNTEDAASEQEGKTKTAASGVDSALTGKTMSGMDSGDFTNLEDFSDYDGHMFEDTAEQFTRLLAEKLNECR